MRANGSSIQGWVRRGLFLLCGVQLEDASCAFEVEDGSIDDELVFASVGWDVVNVFNFVAVGSKGFDDEVDVYHAGQFTRASMVCGLREGRP
jgi:hypothetical protein